MKVVGFTEVHTGADYLYYAIRSAAPYVDHYYVAYGGTPGNRPSRLPCPDTEEELYALAEQACQDTGTPLTWYGRQNWGGRYRQRNSIFNIAQDADVVLLTDADEVWPDGAAAVLIEAAAKGKVRFYRSEMLDFWRSFEWCIPYQSGYPRPLRAYNTRRQGHAGRPSELIEDAMFYHFGWAREPFYWIYKMPVSAHYFRPQHQRWFYDVWLPWNPETGRMHNVHPYEDGRFAEIVPFDKTKLPEFMRNHPYYDLPMIGGPEVVMKRPQMEMVP